MRSYHSSTPLDWSRCQRCPLHTTRRTVVVRRSGLVIPRKRVVHLIFDTPTLPPTLVPFYHPELSAPYKLPYILIIGEAPGRAENNLGVPFWGEAGRILDLLLLYYNTEYFTFTVTNTICCRPTNAASENRKPSPEEQGACADHIVELIHNRKPEGILLLGEVSANYFASSMKDYHDYPHLELIHPAAISRLKYKHLTLRRQGNKLIDWIKTL